MHGAHHVGTDGIIRRCFGDPEVRYLDLSLGRNNNILRLDVTVNNMLVMRRFNSSAYLNGNADGLLKGKLPFFLNIRFQGNPFYIFHHDIMDGILASHVVNIYDIRMFQTCRRLGFRAELGHKIHIIGKFLFQNLNSHITPQGMIFGFIHIGHSAASCFSYDFISVCQIDSFF